MNRFVLISLFVLAAACDLVVEVDIPFKKKLVINSIIHPDSVFSAHVSSNRHILDSLDHPRIDNATVVIYENGSPIETLRSRGGGYYRSDNNRPLAGKSYEIKVTANGFDPISAETYLPYPATINDVKITNEPGNNPWDIRTTVKVKFSDNAMEKNFYQINVYNGYDMPGKNFEIVRYYTPAFLRYEDPTSPNPNDDALNPGTGILLKDILFNGREKEITLQAGTTPGELMLIELRTINEDYYNHLATKAVQQNTNNDPLAQPINVHSNVQNGFGIFSGYSISTFLEGDVLPPVILSASATQASIGSTIILTVENLGSPSPQEFIQAIFNAGFDGYTYSGRATRTSENTIEVIVPNGALSGKFAVRSRNLIGVSDFEIEIID